LNLPETRDFKGKAIALTLVQTPAANRAIWDLYKSPYRSKDIVFNLDTLIDNDENFKFEEFYQLALSDEGIAYKFMQVESQRFQYYLEYKPEMVRELFKKYPGIIIFMKPCVLSAIFANQENLIEHILSDDYSAISALLAINTALANEKAKERVRAFNVESIPDCINNLFQKFNHAHIIQFVNNSFCKDELQSMYKEKDFSFLSQSTLSRELANFILENFSENISRDGSCFENEKILIRNCCDFLYVTDGIPLEVIFPHYCHHFFGWDFDPSKKWEYELLVLLIEKIKIEFNNNKEETKIDTTELKRLIALLPERITQYISIEVDDPWWDCSVFDGALQRLHKDIQDSIFDFTTSEKSNFIQKSDVLFDSDYDVLRKGMHARYRQNLTETAQEFSTVENILSDAKITIRTKLRNALTELNHPEEITESIFSKFSDDDFYPSRLSLEHILKSLDLDQSVKEKVLDRCSDEILPSLLHDSLKQLIFSNMKVDEKTNLMVFLHSVYKDYPQGWARSLLKVLEDYKAYSQHQWVKGIAFALGELREPLGEKIPKMLDKISKDEDFVNLSEIIHRQKMLFSRENFNRGHFRKPQRRVADALQHLVRAHQKIAL